MEKLITVKSIPIINFVLMIFILLVFGLSNPIASVVLFLLGIISFISMVNKGKSKDLEKKKSVKYFYISCVMVVLIFIIMNLVFN